jgi:IS30 family transposase
MTHCYQLSIHECEEISLGLAQGLSKNYIALSLGRSSSTICREVNRNTTKGQASFM